ncbi:MAG: hypothetical protein WD556_05740 [Actinomycetota bacterium]
MRTIMTTTQRTTLARFAIAVVATALVAWLTIAIGARTPAGATHDGDVLLGHFNATNSVTGISNLDAGETALDVDAEGNGPGIFSTSDSGFGVQGASTTSTGVFGSGVNGVRGESITGDGIRGVSASGNGVQGFTSCCGSSGVGVAATSAFGTALEVNGRATFDTSGIATVQAGQTTVAVTTQDISAPTFVLATIQQPRQGVWVRGVALNKPCAGCFRIVLNQAPSNNTRVGWLLVN